MTLDFARGRPGFTLRPFYARELKGKRVLLADDVRNTGQTLARCAQLVNDAGGTVLASMEIYDRLEAVTDLGVPNFALAEYKAPENYKSAACPAPASRKCPSRGFRMNKKKRGLSRRQFLGGTAGCRARGRKRSRDERGVRAGPWPEMSSRIRLSCSPTAASTR